MDTATRTPPSRSDVESALLTPEALAFVRSLHREFDDTRQDLLRRRSERRRTLQQGFKPDFPQHARRIRETAWEVAPCPTDLRNRRVEITGPAEPKMMVNALNSEADVFMVDFEDALSPTWANVLEGHRAVSQAARGTLRHVDEAKGKTYEVHDASTTLIARPRGWHLDDKNVHVDGARISASLFDAGLFLYHNAHALLERGSGPYLYLPKLESHLEARLWNQVFEFAQDALELPRGTIRATVLVETVWAAFEMEEILFELKDHASGLNAGRWDYIFSLVKAFSERPDAILPDRASVTMRVPFMEAYTAQLVRTCHRRGAHAIGGMAAFIPNRRKPEVTERALAKVADDKRHEAKGGFDGTWIAHPDLAATARGEFDEVLGDAPHQIDRRDAGRDVPADALTDLSIPNAAVTEAGVRTNVRVGLRYLAAWFDGRGAVAIDDLMEDAATAEISRAQLWQWLRHGARMDDGRPVTRDLVRRHQQEQRAELQGPNAERAARHLDHLVHGPRFAPFLTPSAYEELP